MSSSIAHAAALAASLIVPHGAAQPAPLLSGSAPTLVGSWDFGDASKLTLTSGSAGGGGNISSISGSDGTTYSLTASGNGGPLGLGPTSVTRNGQLCARFTLTTSGSTTQQWMTCASNLGLLGSAVTMVVIFEPYSSNGGNNTVLELAQSSASSNQNRLQVGYTSSQFYFEKRQNSSDILNVTPSISTPISQTGSRLLVARCLTGTSNPVLNIDYASASTGTATLLPTALNTFTVGAGVAAGSYSGYGNLYVTRILVYAGYLTDAQVLQIQTWAAARYTPVGYPASAYLPSAPVLDQVAAGSPVTWTAGQVIGAPTPTPTFNLFVNGSLAVTNATSGSYTAAVNGDTIVLQQYASNSYGAHVSTSSPMKVGATAVTAYISGLPVVGVPLSYLTTDGTQVGIVNSAYAGNTQQWYKNTLVGQQPIQGATGPTYTPTSNDIGAYLSVRGVTSSGVPFQTTEFGTAVPSNKVGVLPVTATGPSDTTPASTSRPSYNSGIGSFVKNGALYDANGNKFRIRGMNVDHYDSAPSSGCWNTSCNAMRYNFQWGYSSGNSFWNSTLNKFITAKMLPIICPQNGQATFQGTLSGNTLTVSGTTGIIIKGAGVVLNNTSYGTISSFGTGTGGDGTYTLSVTGTVSTPSFGYISQKASGYSDPNIPLSIVNIWTSQASNYLTYDKWLIINIVNEWGTPYNLGAIVASISSNTLTVTSGTVYVGQWLEGSGMTLCQVTSGSGTTWTVSGSPQTVSTNMTDVTWRETYISAISQLRAAGYTCPIMIDAPGSGQDSGAYGTVASLTQWGAAVFNSDPLKNVIFSLHMYGSYPLGTAMATMAKLYALQQATGACVCIGEFGPGTNVGASGYMDPMETIAAAEAYPNIHWIAWAWDDHLDASEPATDDWFELCRYFLHGYTPTANPTQLSRFGYKVFRDPHYGLDVVNSPVSVF